MPDVIRLGDSTSHGGKVIKVTATHFTVGGIAVACVGDICSCPVKGHDNCTIVDGAPGHLVSGIAVAYEGHKTSCGATLVASTGTFEKR